MLRRDFLHSAVNVFVVSAFFRNTGSPYGLWANDVEKCQPGEVFKLPPGTHHVYRTLRVPPGVVLDCREATLVRLHGCCLYLDGRPGQPATVRGGIFTRRWTTGQYAGQDGVGGGMVSIECGMRILASSDDEPA